MNKEIQNQIDQLFSSILVEQSKYMAVKAPSQDKAEETKKILADFAKLKGRGFVYNYYSTGNGHGPFSEISDGSIKYDLIGGIGVNLLGHSHPIYIKSALESATVDTMNCGNLLAYPQAYNLTKAIVDAAGPKLKHFWFAGSGSFANDNALKMIWQKKSPAYKLIAFEKAFAGRSIATQDITHNKAYKVGMPDNLEVFHVPHYDQNNPDNALDITMKALEETLKQDPTGFCAITIEVIQGEGGFIYGDKNYYETIFKWAKKNNLYVWVDEVQTFGRTTELFAFQTFELEEYVDIVTVGKALQCCGTLFSEELNPKPGLISGTFNGPIASLIAGEKTIRYLTEGNFYGKNGRIKEIQTEFITRLNKLMSSTCKNKITYAGGIGTMISFEVGDSSKDITVKFIQKLYSNGIIAFMAGANPTRVRFLLPLSITKEHIEEIFDILEKTILEVVK